MADEEWVEMMIGRGVPPEELERRDAVQDQLLNAGRHLKRSERILLPLALLSAGAPTTTRRTV
jgi:hypothetical protein